MANLMDLEKFRNSDPLPVYQLSGKDVFLRDSVYKGARSRIEKQARSFDWGSYDLEEDSESQVVLEARTLPWMSPKRWLYVRNAHLAGPELRSYLKSPSDRTVMILELMKKPGKWPRLPVIKEEGANSIRWVKERLRRDQFKIDGAAARTLVELTGDDRQRLALELDKLILHCAGTSHIDRESVLELTQQTQDYDVFALIGCLVEGTSRRALQVLNRLYSQGMGTPQILSLLYWNFRRLLVARERLEGGERFPDLVKDLKIWSYRGRRSALEATSCRWLAGIAIRLREADRMCKTTGTDERLALEQLVVDACRGPSL